LVIIPTAVKEPTEQKQRALRKRKLTQRGDTLTATLFLAPGMIAFLLFVIVPALAGLGLSFFSWDLFDPPQFVGLENITRLFTDPDMWHALFVSFMFVVLGVIPTTVIGFVLAVVVNSKMRGVSIFRVLYLAPIVASSAVSSVIWINLYQPKSGLVNQVLGWIGIVGPNWLSDPVWARPALAIMMSWGALPLVILLYVSALQRVPEDIYAAASIDGAGKWRQLWSMTWPNVTPTTLVVVILEFVGFLSGSFEIALIMTAGGPLSTTTSLALYSYDMAFQQHDIGYASALSLFQLVLLIALYFAGRGLSRLFRRAA
jgi:multiple sugar transport system permease protein